MSWLHLLRSWSLRQTRRGSILTTALFVQAGTQTATLLACLPEGTPFCAKANPKSVTDIQGVLIFLNFAVAFWFAYKTLGDTAARSGPISLDVKIIGLGTAFLSSIELYGYALKNGVPERLVFALPIIFFVFLVPFVLKRPVDASDDADDPVRVTRQVYSSLRQLVVALVVCAAAIVAGAAYYVFLNEGLRFGLTLVEPFVDRKVWGFNPAILGLGWLAALTISAQSNGTNPSVVPMSVTLLGRNLLVAGPVVINAAIGIVMISDASLGIDATAGQGWAAPLAKAALGAGLTLLFLGAFFVSKRLGLGSSNGLLPGALVFAAAGVLAGAAVAAVQAGFGSSVQYATTLAIHSGGFVLSYLVGISAWRRVRTHFPDMTLQDSPPAGPVASTGA